uniref:Uncharacterized protein n=1 Tax=viral metagenome TaxID=1070528 RepID=A0A6C0KPJ4_9ZZZZ
MGNQLSNIKKEQPNLKPKSISQILDYISTYYITTLDFKSLRKLYEKEYCDKLVILTSDIVERYFTDIELTYLNQRIKNGVEVNETDKDKIIYFFNDDIKNLDIQNSIKKKRICQSIAKFYIKIAHLFAAIVTTINPIYVYKDQDGNTVRATLAEKGKIPAKTPRDIYKLNICDNRINSLKNNSKEVDENGDITINPKVCSMNIRDDGQDKTLEDEPGIPELVQLYYDDNYDFDSGKFSGMSEDNKKAFLEDLKIFYNVFTGKTNMPENITKFSDIKLRDYHRMKECQGPDPVFERTYKGPKTNKLFLSYAENLKKMIQNTNKNQNALISIINQLFVYTIDPQTLTKKIRVNPELTEAKLQEIVIETRALIIKLYLTCETDYVNGLKLFEAIVDQKIFETAKSQIANLEKLSDQLVSSDQVPQSAEIEQLKEKAVEQKQEINKQIQELKKDEQILNQNPIESLAPVGYSAVNKPPDNKPPVGNPAV